MTNVDMTVTRTTDPDPSCIWYEKHEKLSTTPEQDKDERHQSFKSRMLKWKGLDKVQVEQWMTGSTRQKVYLKAKDAENKKLMTWHFLYDNDKTNLKDWKIQFVWKDCLPWCIIVGFIQAQAYPLHLYCVAENNNTTVHYNPIIDSLYK